LDDRFVTRLDAGTRIELSARATPRLVDCRAELAGIITDFDLDIV
jgi:hypothetical protein